MAAKILLVDDDPLARKSLSNLLRRERYEVAEAADGQEALRQLDNDLFDLVITDLNMEPMSGLELLRAAKLNHSDLEVIVVTAFGTIDIAVEAMKLRAFDFVTKPFQPDEISLRVGNALEKRRLKDEVRRLQMEAKNAFGIEGIVGRSAALRPILSILPRIAQTDSTVLITGESGTGKELVARAIAGISRRASGPFLSINCAALPETLLEVELFGSVKGVFTDATTRKGLFEETSGGTLFLDEIAEASLSTQVKLLRVLEERSVRRLGDSRQIPVDVRFLAATHQNLEELVKSNRFRQDLYFRLNVVPLKLPSLRERVEDIPLLVAHFIDKYNRTLSKKIVGITPEATALMMAYPWPGNVRELDNIVHRMIIVTGSDILDIADLPTELRAPGGELAPAGKDFKVLTREITHQAEKSRIIEALTAHRWNITHTARDLKMSRATLQNKMKKFNLRSPAP